MSTLDRPRLCFSGTLAVSTPTANNNNYDLVLEPDTVALFPKFTAMADDQFRQAMKTLVLKNLTVIGEGYQEVLEANWDYYGDNRLWLEDAIITGYDPPKGPRVTHGDPIIGTPMTFLGNAWGDSRGPAIIVDNDPTGDISSQAFIAQVNVGATGAMIKAETSTTAMIPRTYSRWLDLFRNLDEEPDTCFSAIWQLALPNDVLAFDGAKSDAVKELARAARAGQGLVVRFCTYFFERKFTDPALAKLFAAGETVQNVSSGKLLGVIAPWGNGELGSVPAGRRLDPGATLTSPITGKFVSKYQLGPAVAGVVGDQVVLDLIAAVPERDGNLDKVDLGVATLQARGADGKVTHIADIPYDKATYEAGGGIVELPLTTATRAAAETGNLEIVSPAAPTPLLAEIPYVAESDDRSVYLNVGTTAVITVQVTKKGATPTGPVPLAIQQYRSTQRMGTTTDGTAPLPEKLMFLCPTQGEPVVRIEPQGTIIPQGDGTAAITLTGIAPGLAVLRFLPGTVNPPDPVPGDFAAWMLPFFVNVRVLPDDAHLDAIPDDQISWDCVYQNVLQYYWRLYPTMDPHLDLSNQAQCTAAAQMILLLTDASNWFSTLYMPITRELSDGRRRLLHRWCQRVMAGQPT